MTSAGGRQPIGTQFGFKATLQREPPGVFLEVFNPSTGRLAPFRHKLGALGRIVLCQSLILGSATVR
jgi:hypothetical protein